MFLWGIIQGAQSFSRAYPESKDLHIGGIVKISSLLYAFMWVKEKDDNGMIPLHNAYSQNLSNHVINLLIDAYLEGADVVDKHGKKAKWLGTTKRSICR